MRSRPTFTSRRPLTRLSVNIRNLLSSNCNINHSVISHTLRLQLICNTLAGLATRNAPRKKNIFIKHYLMSFFLLVSSDGRFLSVRELQGKLKVAKSLLRGIREKNIEILT